MNVYFFRTKYFLPSLHLFPIGQNLQRNAFIHSTKTFQNIVRPIVMVFTIVEAGAGLLIRFTSRHGSGCRRICISSCFRSDIIYLNRHDCIKDIINHKTISSVGILKLQSRQRFYQKSLIGTTSKPTPIERKHFSTSYQPFIRDFQTSNLGLSQDQQDQLRSSGRVVWGAVIINGANFLAKTIAWIYTGSHSMFAESIHSLADTANQLILAVGIRKSLQSPTADHPYGYHPMRYIAPLISGVGIFCVGCGLSIYHGCEALFTSQPELFISPLWAYGILLFSFLSESTTLFMATQALRSGAKKSKLKVRDYIAQNSDPGVIVVLLEDLAAVVGIGIAAGCMGLSSYYNTHVFDACGSLIIGSLLGGVATFIIKKNTVALVGKSIPKVTLNNMNRIIEKDVLIRAIHDVKAMDLGNGVVRYKAEVDVDGRELTKKYLEKIDLNELVADIKEIKSEKDAEAFILAHGEGVVDILGAEVDRIEKELRRKHPKVKHVDLEVL